MEKKSRYEETVDKFTFIGSRLSAREISDVVKLELSHAHLLPQPAVKTNRISPSPHL